MPIPKPNDGEQQDHFISRCMANNVMVQDYPDNKQRLAICFQSWQDRNKREVNNLEHKVVNFEVKQIGQDSQRTLGFVGSTESIDRDGDIIQATGWDLTDYNNNPVIMGFHEYDQFPYAKSTRTYVDYNSKQLKFEVKFPTISELTSFPGDPQMIADHAKNVDMAYNMYKNGYMNAVSVGFIGQESEPRIDEQGNYAGKIYKKQSLLELSLVPVPSNPTALLEARSKGLISDKELKILQIEEKAVVPYHKYGLAPEGESWDGPREIATASVDDLKIMSTWYDSANAENKGAYKLPHHKQSGYSTVWRAVAAAMGALLGARGGVQIPEGDRKGVYNHLAKHYDDFGKTAPDFKSYTDIEIKAMFPEIKVFDFQRNVAVSEIVEAIEGLIDPEDTECCEVVELYPVNYPSGYVVVEMADECYLYDYTYDIASDEATMGMNPVHVEETFVPKAFINKSGASISGKNRDTLNQIHDGLDKCKKDLRTLLDYTAPTSQTAQITMPMQPMPTQPMMSAMRTVSNEEIKSALDEIKSQVLLLSQKSESLPATNGLPQTVYCKDAVKVIDLASIEYTPLQKDAPQNELNIEPEVLKNMIKEIISNNIQGGI